MSAAGDTHDMNEEEIEEPSNANFDDFVETLSQFDSDGKGMIQSAELRHILTSLGKVFFDWEFEQC